MFRKLVVAVVVSMLLAGGMMSFSQAQEGGWWYTAQTGDTVGSIASQHQVPLERLLTSNGLHVDSQLYVGQRLLIPGAVVITPAQDEAQSEAEAAEFAEFNQEATVYLVKVGDTLPAIAHQVGVSVPAIRQANGLGETNLIYPGQRLTIPVVSETTDLATIEKSETASSLVSSIYNTDPTPEELAARWIYVDLSEQSLTAYQGVYPVFTTLVSTGLARYPTVVGDFEVYVKYDSTRMTGGYGADYYDLANVPHTMYFYGGYALHGAYWHDNFGNPMSHGCVNLALPDAELLYNWAAVGTKVVVRE